MLRRLIKSRRCCCWPWSDPWNAESHSRWSRLPGFRGLCVTTLTWDPMVRACAVGCVYCGYVKGGNPAVGVPPGFSSVRVSLPAPCNYCPADKMDSRHGLVFVAAALVAPLFLCLPTPQKPLWFSGFCHPATDSRWYGFVSSLEPLSLLHFDGEGLNLSQENVCVSLPEWTL